MDSHLRSERAEKGWRALTALFELGDRLDFAIINVDSRSSLRAWRPALRAWCASRDQPWSEPARGQSFLDWLEGERRRGDALERAQGASRPREVYFAEIPRGVEEGFILARINENRNNLIRALNGVLCLVGEGDFVRRFAYAAPSIWSMRSEVVDLVGSPPARFAQPLEEEADVEVPAEESFDLDVFVSADGRDAEHAKSLCNRLRGDGLNAEVGHGALPRARFVVVMLSSSYAYSEAWRAFQASEFAPWKTEELPRRIILVRLSMGDTPAALNGLIALDYQTPEARAASYRTLVRRVKGVRGPGEGPGLAAPERGRKRDEMADGVSKQALAEALIEAFPDMLSLDVMLREQLSKRREEIASLSNLRDVVWELVSVAEAEGWMEQLLTAALRAQPGNKRLWTLRSWAYGAPNNLPPRRLFVGREREIAAIAEALERGGQGSITQASVWGMGGVGKTALALEYARRVLEAGRYPGGVWWLVAEGDPLDVMLRLAAAIREHAPHLMADIPVDLPADELVSATRRRLEEQAQPSLLVLDNVEEALTPLLPGGQVHVLITTRKAAVAVGAPIALDVLDEADALSLATRIDGLPRNEQERAAMQRVVVGALGSLAVAVEVAANAVKRWVDGWASYEELLGDSSGAIDAEQFRSENYPRGVFAALDFSIGKAGAIARTLLDATAAFAPDEVPLEWAYAVAELDPEGIEAQEGLGELLGFGLIKVDNADSPRLVSVHRLVHGRVRTLAEPAAWEKVGRRTVSHVKDWLVSKGSTTQNKMGDVDARRTHIEEALIWAEELGDERAWSELATMLIHHLFEAAHYRQARALAERALALDEKVFGLEHPNVAKDLSNLALTHKQLGELGKARVLLERALAIDEKTSGSNHPDVARDLSNLAMVYEDLGEPGSARRMLERTLGISEKTFGHDHPNVAFVLSNLAKVLKALGEPDNARPLLERALAIAEKTLGPDHPNVAAVLLNLAVVLTDLGEPGKARPLLERTLHIVRETFGPDHPTTLLVRNNLAQLTQSTPKGH